MNAFGLALRRLRIWTLAAGTLLTCLGALAQDWPSKPVRIVVGGPAGGTADVLARLVAEGLTQALGKPVIVDAKPGAAGAIAVNELIKSPRDGHTLMLIQGGIVSETPQAYKVNFQPFKDIKPLAQVSRQGLILVANNNLPARNLKELVSYLKSQNGPMSYASYASGMRAHTSGVLFGRLAGVELSHVGYKGSPPALQDVMGGHVPLMFDAPATSLPLIKAGKLRAYAVNFPSRLTSLPDVPTFAELGYPALNDVGWMGLWSTPDVPTTVQARVREITLQYLKQPAIRQRIEALGMEAGQPLTSEELAKELRAAYDQQGEMLRSIQYKPE